mmetsp:Transcript_14532/g.36881  ORF Transcript_14532/g.36881 Transcript_14532/m.36881 type:complete len:181 (+) Transcript_14532:58-600(+)
MVWHFGTVYLAFMCCIGSPCASYSKPPCQSGEMLASVSGRVVCAPTCDEGGGCRMDKPAGTVADPRCILQPLAHVAGQIPGTYQGQKFCGLVCTADSYCPTGSKCTKLLVGSGEEDKDNPLSTISTVLIPQEDVKGVCTYKAKKRKKKDPTQVLELSMKKLAYEVMRERHVMPPPGHTEL